MLGIKDPKVRVGDKESCCLQGLEGAEEPQMWCDENMEAPDLEMRKPDLVSQQLCDLGQVTTFLSFTL